MTQRDGQQIGQRLRELRLERGMQQSEVARRLGVSAAYLNLMEKGKRAVQLPLLWKALSLYELEIEGFMASLGESRAPEALAKLLDEPLLNSLGITDEDLAAFSGEPRRTATLVALFNLYKGARAQLENVMSRLAAVEDERRATDPHHRVGPVGTSYSPSDEITDFLQAHKNYFPDLEEEAKRIRRDHALGPRTRSEQLVEVLAAQKVKVEFTEPGSGSTVVRRYEPERRLLRMSTVLLEQPLKFQLAHTVGLRVVDDTAVHERLTRLFAPKHAETAKLIKIHLANYFAGALLLPYDEFFAAVEQTRYELELLSNMFEMSYEAVAHRVCNLSDPKRAGIPMHFVRCDVAGNMSKRYSATGLRFPDSGSCGKWAVHQAFLNPSVVTRQYSAMPDGTTYFCFAKVAIAPAHGSVVRGTTYSIGLGTHADAAKHLAYADELPYSEKVTIPVGVSCRFCERTDCNQRAAPSFKFAFKVDEYVKKDNFYSPLLDGDRIPRSKLVKR